MSSKYSRRTIKSYLKLNQLNQKGDINLSINAVVILILALVMLGVGIAFIRGTFGGLIGNVEDIGASLGEQRLQELRDSRQEVGFLQQGITIKSTRAKIPYSIHNNELATANFNINFACDSLLGGDQSILSQVRFENDEDVKNIKPGETRLLYFFITLPPSASSGIILSCGTDVTKDDGTVYGEKRFEVEYIKK